MNAPRIDNYISQLRDGEVVVNDKTRDIIGEIFELLNEIKPCGDDNRKELWLRAGRGTIDDYGNYDEFLYDEIVSTHDEFVELWKEEYPDDEKWYHFVTIEHDDYKAIFLGRKLIYQSEIYRIGGNYYGYEADLSDLFSWVKDAVNSCIIDTRNGIYNDRVERELPAEHRTGVIARKDFWNALPEYKKDYYEEISEDEVKTFLYLISEQVENKPVGKYISRMTAFDFYRFCSIGYAANHYERAIGKTAKEQYYRIADGRDDGLGEIDENSPEEFLDWLENRKWRGGHPWEVCAGGNSTHIDLYVNHDENGFSLGLRGTSYGRSIETVKFYNALRSEGIAVYLIDADKIASRFKEDDEIGIVPDGVYPFYCESWFPCKSLADYMNLPFEKADKEKILPFIKWFQEVQAELI